MNYNLKAPKTWLNLAILTIALTSTQPAIADPVRGIVDRNLVTFIFAPQNETNSVPIGTGFFVGIPTQIDPAVSTLYLVTAKHVLLDETGKLQPHITLRINGKKGGFYTLHFFSTAPLPATSIRTRTRL